LIQCSAAAALVLGAHNRRPDRKKVRDIKAANTDTAEDPITSCSSCNQVTSKISRAAAREKQHQQRKKAA
jgi:hypothetical protein